MLLAGHQSSHRGDEAEQEGRQAGGEQEDVQPGQGGGGGGGREKAEIKSSIQSELRVETFLKIRLQTPSSRGRKKARGSSLALSSPSCTEQRAQSASRLLSHWRWSWWGWLLFLSVSPDLCFNCRTEHTSSAFSDSNVSICNLINN